MGIIEDKVKADINTKFGSIPKMARATGMPYTTIVHALQRGLENTTSRTRSQIYKALYGDDFDYPEFETDTVRKLSDDEMKLIMLFRRLSEVGRHAVLAGLEDYVSRQ